MGIVVDRFPDDNHRQSFPIMGAVILALALLNTAAFLRMKEARTLPKDAQGKEMHGALLRRYDARQHSRKASTLQEIRSAFGHEGFRKALILNCIWNAAFYVAQPFNASYQLKELKLSYSLIMIITFGCSLIRVALTPAIGKRGDRRGMGRTLCHVFLLYILGNVFLMLAVPGNALPMFMASSLCTSISWAFIGIGMFCIQLELLDPRKRTLQMSIITALSGTFAFLVSALAGRLIDYLQSYPVRIANVQLYAQQVTNFLGILATAAVILYLWFIVCRVEKQTPEADA
jgi:MFS family permease